MSTNEELRLLREYPLYPQSCSHGEETWYCDGCRHGWEKALTAWNMKRKELLARHPEPAAPVPSETDRERARKWLRQFRYDDMQTDSLAAEFAAIRAGSYGVGFIDGHNKARAEHSAAPCSVCAGVPLTSGRECICGGRGTEWAESDGLRRYVFQLEKEKAEHSAAVKSADEIVEELASLAYRTPFRPHNYSNIEFDSGCIQTRDKIVSVLRSKKGTFELKGEEG